MRRNFGENRIQTLADVNTQGHLLESGDFLG
jgi:hypothetical protein